MPKCSTLCNTPQTETIASTTATRLLRHAANQTERRGGELALRSYHECLMGWQQHRMFQHNDAEASRKGVGQQSLQETMLKRKKLPSGSNKTKQVLHTVKPKRLHVKKRNIQGIKLI